MRRNDGRRAAPAGGCPSGCGTGSSGSKWTDGRGDRLGSVDPARWCSERGEQEDRRSGDGGVAGRGAGVGGRDAVLTGRNRTADCGRSFNVADSFRSRAATPRSARHATQLLRDAAFTGREFAITGHDSVGVYGPRRVRLGGRDAGCWRSAASAAASRRRARFLPSCRRRRRRSDTATAARSGVTLRRR